MRALCARRTANAQECELAGHAIIVVGPDRSACVAALKRAALESELDFLELSDDGKLELPPMAAIRRAGPLMIYLQADPYLLDADEVEDTTQRDAMRSAQARVADWMPSFDPAHPIVVATCAANLTDIGQPLRDVGLFNRFFRIPAPTFEAYGREFIQQVGQERCGTSILNSVAKVGMLYCVEYDTERRKALAALCLRRLAARERRLLEFSDLVTLSLHGFAEEDARPADASEVRRQTAYHEAGHATVAILDSNGQNIPEHSSIVPSASHDGVVVGSLEYIFNHSSHETYADMRHDVRVSLAGRAAEELVFGAERVSNGASSDLRNAVLHAGAGFAFWGFSPDMENPGGASSNLMVIGIDGDDFSPSEQAHLEALVRRFLAKEYEAVKALLAGHRPLLDDIANRLLHDAVVDQATLTEIARRHVPEAFTLQPDAVATP
ncbi:MAG TPA: hypothetical protein VIJ16_10660 [Gemmatimonadaceae bacterium]